MFCAIKVEKTHLGSKRFICGGPARQSRRAANCVNGYLRHCLVILLLKALLLTLLESRYEIHSLIIKPDVIT